MFVRPNKTKVATANDVVYTNSASAQTIIDHFRPTGSILEPCRGGGAFYDQFQEPKFWCEITEGRDFFDFQGKVDWVITNPPFSIFDAFLEKCFEVADHVVLFIPLPKVFKSMKIDKMITAYGGLKEIVHMGSGGKHGFSFGFPVGCVYYQKGYRGPITYTQIY